MDTLPVDIIRLLIEHLPRSSVAALFSKSRLYKCLLFW